MKRPTFSSSASAAFAVSLAAGAAWGPLASLLGGDAALRLATSLAGLGYLGWLLCVAAGAPGRFATIVLWCLFSAALAATSLSVYLLAHVAALWLARSLHFHSGIVPALLDLGLSILGLSAATWAFTRSGSVFLAAWSFLLVQALFVFIPPSPVDRLRPGADPSGDEAFERARRRADAALRRLLHH